MGPSGSKAGEVRDSHNLPDLAPRGFDLEVHVGVSKVNPGLVIVGRDPIFVSNGAEMVELLIEDTRDILDDSVVAIPEKFREAKNSSCGGTSVKLRVKSIPLRLVWRENTDNILHCSGMVFHLTFEILHHEQLHGILRVLSVVKAAHLVNILL